MPKALSAADESRLKALLAQGVGAKAAIKRLGLPRESTLAHLASRGLGSTRATSPSSVPDDEAIRKCNRCAERLPLAAFGLDPTKPRGRSYRCLACARAYAKERYRARRGKVA